MARDTIVLYPSPAMGHLISMVEFGKLIINHYPSFSITILITTPPYNTGSTKPYINHVSRTTKSILFHNLPIISLPLSSTTNTSPHLETLAFELLSLNNPNVHQAIQTISQTSTVRSLIIDFFCTSTLCVAKQLNIPTYCFFTSAVAALAFYLYFPTVHNSTTKSFKDDLKKILYFPGLPPIPCSDMAKPMMDRKDKAYEWFLYMANDLPKLNGIIINSFDSLEPRVLKAVSDGLCVPDGPTPPVYCIGPLIASDHRSGADGERTHECLAWLDSQPSRSVVFLCFGSLGLFSAPQLKEIAIGLEKSGQRFLWVVRSPPVDEKIKKFLPPLDPDLDALLPDGFLDRTKDRGLVVKSWAPQVEVLSCESVGGFVTHCGWNSILEAVCAGVPMVAWPLYAGQRLNRVILVEEMKVALPMEESEDGFVSTCEVEKRVRELMNSNEGKMLRERIKKMSDDAMAAMSEGGSSRRALAKLVELWKDGK